MMKRGEWKQKKIWRKIKTATKTRREESDLVTCK
jgi:hypothetical protein